MGDTDADGAAVKWTGQPREGAEGTDADAEGAAVKRTGQPKEGGTEWAMAFSWERVRPVGRAKVAARHRR